MLWSGRSNTFIGPRERPLPICPTPPGTPPPNAQDSQQLAWSGYPRSQAPSAIYIALACSSSGASTHHPSQHSEQPQPDPKKWLQGGAPRCCQQPPSPSSSCPRSSWRGRPTWTTATAATATCAAGRRIGCHTARWISAPGGARLRLASKLPCGCYGCLTRLIGRRSQLTRDRPTDLSDP